MKPNYSSEDEYLFATQLDELGIEYEEQVPFIIDKGFKRTNGKMYKDSVYTIDFLLKTKEQIYAIEIKGWSMYDDPFKYRIAEKKFAELGYIYEKLKISGSTKDGTLGFYDYSSGFKNKALTKKQDIENKLSKQLLYNINVNIPQGGLKPLKRVLKCTYEDVISKKTNSILKKGVFTLANEEWYRENLDDSEMTNEFFEDYITDNYVIIGKGKDETKWKYIYKGESNE